MKKQLLTLISAVPLLASLILVGCGGGGGSTPPPPGGGSRTQAFLTSSSGRDMSTGYDHIFVNVFEIELKPTGGGRPITVFDRDEGQIVDLAALNEGAGKFLALGGREVPDGAYRVEVEVGRDLTLFTTGATSGTPARFAPAFDDSTPGVSKIELDGTLTVAGQSKVVVDFRLGAWTFSGGVVTPAASVGDDVTIGDDNQIKGEFDGTVTALTGTAPDQTFVLDIGFGFRLTVATNSRTAIFNESGADSPALANGQRVEAKGFYDAVSDRMIARTIRIEAGDDDSSRVSIEGILKSPDEATGTFKVRADECDDFLPDDLLFDVTTTEATVFHDSDGFTLTRGEFFAVAVANPDSRVEARGDLDPATNSLAASKVKIETGDDDDDREAGVSGPVSNIVPGASFQVTLVDWEGFSGGAGDVVTVTVDPSTKFRNEDGRTVTGDDFFAALAAGRIVEAEGVFDGTALQAKEVRLEGRDDDDRDEVSVCGYASNDDQATGRFDVQLVDWDGFDASFGKTVVVQTDAAGTRFVDVNGNEVTKEEFFGMLSEGTEVEVEGNFDGKKLNATFAKIYGDDDDDDDDGGDDRP